MDRKGILLVLSGFAGSGKGTICKELLNRYDNYAFSVSATTRSPREGEKDGVDYFFISKEKFQEMIENGEFLEYANYVTNSYGTPKKYVENMLNEGKDVILEIECQGALSVKTVFPEAVLVFVMPPTVQEIYNRLHKRATEQEDVIIKRMERGSEEVNVIERYDYLLINDDLSATVDELNDIVNSSRFTPERNAALIENIKNQFDDFLKNVK